MSYDYELIIVGGGISGLGVALAATERGIPSLVLEARTIASATSNNTLRIIHGGFRYLQKLQLLRVVRSLNDQTYVATNFSDAVSPLACLMPLQRFGLKSRLPVTAAALMYGATMKLARSPLPTPQVLSHTELSSLAPQLASRAPYGALCWCDYLMTNPEAIAEQLVQKITAHGAIVQDHTTVTAVHPIHNGFTVTTSAGQSITARHVVNTLGPWIHSISLPHPMAKTNSQWCLGFNITTSRQIHPTHAIAVESRDGRLFFAVPRGATTTIGTWYTPCVAPTAADLTSTLTIPPNELKRFIDSWNCAWPEQALSPDDVIATDAGVLPMSQNGPHGPELQGAEVIENSATYCEVLSTKYTTFRSQGKKVIRRITSS